MTVTAMRKTKEKVKTLGSVIDEMATIRDARTKLAVTDKAMKADYDLLQVELIGMLQAQGTVSGASTAYTASISQSEVFNIVDFDVWVAFANKNKLTHAFYKQVSAPSIREYVALHKGKVPAGLEPFSKLSISLTARN